MPYPTTRRYFLQSATAAAFAAPLIHAQENKPSANERLHVAVVGVTGQGGSDMDRIAAAGAEIVALCDIDENRAADARKRFPKATFTPDYRKLFDQKGIDAVLIGTPDHSHAPATVRALQAGLHVFCEKPLTHTVHEARVVAALAAKQKRVTQMGNQIHAGTNYRRVVELIQTGAIGAVREVHVWCARSWGGGDRPKEVDPVPPHVHWDLWLGPAPVRPYHAGTDKQGHGTYHSWNWRRWWDFGGGTLTDMACHHMDLPFWALNLGAPTTVAAEGSKPHPETVAEWTIIHYEFPARDKLPPVKLTWYDGGKRPKHFEEHKLPKWGDGSLFVGEKGMLLAGYNNHVLLPEDTFKDFARPKPFIPDSIGHYKEWVEACKTGGPTTCNFAYAAALTQLPLLGIASYRLGQALTWDAVKMQAVNEPEAERYLRKEYRKGWEV